MWNSVEGCVVTRGKGFEVFLEVFEQNVMRNFFKPLIHIIFELVLPKLTPTREKETFESSATAKRRSGIKQGNITIPIFAHQPVDRVSYNDKAIALKRSWRTMVGLALVAVHFWTQGFRTPIVVMVQARTCLLIDKFVNASTTSFGSTCLHHVPHGERHRSVCHYDGGRRNE